MQCSSVQKGSGGKEVEKGGPCAFTKYLYASEHISTKFWETNVGGAVGGIKSMSFIECGTGHPHGCARHWSSVNVNFRERASQHWQASSTSLAHTPNTNILGPVAQQGPFLAAIRQTSYFSLCKCQGQRLNAGRNRRLVWHVELVGRMTFWICW